MATTVILVVEDDAAVQGMLRMAFHSAGFQVLVADTGDDALKQCQEQYPDAVTMDLTLPDGKAGNVLEWLRRHDIPWLVISSVDEHDAVKQHGSFNGRFVAKPFDPWDVVGRFESILCGNRA